MGLQGKTVIAVGVAGLMFLLALDYGGFTASSTGAVTIAIWWSIALGLVLGLFPREWIPRAAAVAGGLLVLLVLLTGASIDWASDRGLAFSEAVQMAMISGAFLLTILLSRRGEGRAWLAGVAFGLFGIVFLALVSRFFPGLGDDRELTATLGEIVGGRLSWPLGYWNAIGAVTALFAVVATFFGANGSTRLWRSLATATLPSALVVFYLCSSRGALVAALAGIVLLVALGPSRTGKLGTLFLGFAGGVGPVIVASRSTDLVNAQASARADEQGLILLAVTVLATGLTFLVRYLSDRMLLRVTIPRRVGWFATGAVALLAVAAVVAADPVQRFDAFTKIPTEAPTISDENAYATEHLLGDGGNGRWQLWASAYRAAEAEPLLGVGAGGYADWFRSDGDIWLKTVDAHSSPLQILAELGVPGFLLFIGFLLIAAAVGVKRLVDGRYANEVGKGLPGEQQSEPDWSELPAWLSVLLVGTVALSIDWSLEFPVVAIPLMIVAAMLCGPAYRVAPTPREETRAATLALTALLVPLAAIILVMSWKQYDAARSIEASRQAFDDGNSVKALDEARKAMDATPWAGEPYSQGAAVLAATGRPRLALRYAVDATRESPRETPFWIQRARIEYQLGLGEKARRSLGRAEQTDPKAPIWANLAK